MFQIGDRVLVKSITIVQNDLRHSDKTIMSWVRKIGRVGVAFSFRPNSVCLRFYDGLMVSGFEKKDLEYADQQRPRHG